MILASRKSPPKYLQVPKSSQSSFAFKDLLLYSPLPSPSLPALIPRHGKKPPPLNTRRVLRYLCWLSIIILVVHCLRWVRRTEETVVESVYRHDDGQAYEIVEDFSLPDYPSPLAVTDVDGESRWTIHIPPNRGFPLPSKEYEDICSHIDEVEQHVAAIRGNAKAVADLKYYDQDPNYIDVAHAQLNDLIPFDPSVRPGGNMPVCSSSMIYVLDSEDAGLGGSLLGLWLAYGLAQQEKRAFFIDDTHFTYGRYADLLQRPPRPKCQPPPPTHRVPCPRMSQHLVVSSSTWRWTFGKAFHEKFSTKEIFDMMRVGYEALFILLPDDQAYVDARLSDLRSRIGDGNLMAGLHIRRGDLHPDEFQYHQGYIPPTLYVSALKKLIDSTTTTYLSATSHSHPNSTFILASDDADMYLDPELNGLAIRAQERITLASAKQLGQDAGPGWERGFFKDAFWNLGVPDFVKRDKMMQLKSPVPTKDSKYQQVMAPEGEERNRNYRLNPTSQALQLRNYIGRAYLLDLAVLAHSDRLVCAVSSRGCQILGVMMGWQKIEKGHWKNIDMGEDVEWKSL